jgi:hypothetical protein
MRAMTASAAGSSVRPTRPRLPWILLAITVVLVVTMLFLSLGQEELFDTLFYGALALALATTGALVASRQPANPIGWLFCAMGVWGGFVEMWEAFDYRSLPTGDAGAWVTGRPLTSRWRWVLWLLAAACVVGIPGQALNPENPDNPLVVDSPVLEAAFIAGMMMLLVAMGGAIASLVVRYRRSTGIERLQLRQLVFAAAAFVPIMVVAVPFYYDYVVVQAAVGLGLLGLPVAAGLAILRYRLYDIDVVINRALVYGSLTATLAAVYVGSVLLLQLALSGLTQGSGLAVAASTLAVAALFRPARGRIQKTVDRRFFRSRYDAARTIESFGARLRDEVDLVALSSDLQAVVSETMRPAHVSLWLRDAKANVS